MPKRDPLDECLFSTNEDISCVIHAKTILGMNNFFTFKDIKKNFRVLAKKHHPDKAKTEDKANAHYDFQRISGAYELLKKNCDK